MSNRLKISWYGRCCFLVECEKKKILFDPYDTYCGVDIGLIESDILVSSSTWHDHGHIGASPKAHIYTYPGKYKNDGVKITGMEAKEERGSPTVVFNVQIGDFSLTNFADFYSEGKGEFYETLSSSMKSILASSNIIFARPSIVGNKITKDNIHNESFLEFCEPSIIFPEHYFPESFIEENVPKKLKQDFLRPHIIVDEMIKSLQAYTLEEIDDSEIVLSKSDLKKKKVLKFLRLHDQVNYID